MLGRGGQEIDCIRDWAGKNFTIKVLVSHVWLMGSSAKSDFGFVILVTDVMGNKPVYSFPFARQSEEL